MTVVIHLISEILLDFHDSQFNDVQKIALLVNFFGPVPMFFGPSLVNFSIFGSFGLVLELLNFVRMFVFYVSVKGGIRLVYFGTLAAEFPLILWVWLDRNRSGLTYFGSH
jgi:hypothetical protein